MTTSGAESAAQETNIATRFVDDNVQAGRGDRPAIYYRDRTYTYDEVRRLMNRLANVLKDVGIEPENRVLIVMKDSPEFIATWFATLKIGAVTTEVYTFLPESDIRNYLITLRPKVVVADETTTDKVRRAADGLRYPKSLLITGLPRRVLRTNEYSLDTLIETASDECEPEPTRPDQMAFFLFSGGTTGEVKGVPHRHYNGHYIFDTLQPLLKYAEDDVVLPIPKLFFGYARLYGVMCPFGAGAASVLYPERATAGRVFELIQKHTVTMLINVPTMMRQMVDLAEKEPVLMSHVRVSTSAGEHLPPELYLRWKKALGVEVVNILGSTELGGIPCLANPPGQQVPGSLGKPWLGIQAKIVDPETREELPPGRPGVLLLRSEGAGLYYWENYDKTRRTFLGDGWVTNNDLFTKDEAGNYWFAGRADELIKVSGTFISPSEIEVCLEEHPSIAECAVVGVQDVDGLMTTKAFIVLGEQESATGTTGDEIQTFVKERLAPHKYPRHVCFVDDLPKTGQGKIDRRRLRERDI